MASRPTRVRRQATENLEQQSRAKWTFPVTKTLVDLIVNQIHKGNRHNGSFSKKAWKHICNDFYRKTTLRWGVEQLKNRYGVLRRQYFLVKSILDRIDFSWDESTGDITGEDVAWDQCIKDNPEAEAIKANGCPIFKELCTIFSEPTGNGKDQYAAECEDVITPAIVCPDPLRSIKRESPSSSEYEEAEDGEIAETTDLTAPTNQKKGRKGIEDKIAGAILEMAAASKWRTDVVQKHKWRYSVADCMKELNVMEDVDRRLYFHALDLFNKPSARETFLSLKGEKRLSWLRRKCTTHSNPINSLHSS